MATKRLWLTVLSFFYSAFFYSAFFYSEWALAEITETRPDGTVVKTVTYYPPMSEMIIIGIVVVFGGIVALFGAWLILKALQLGRSDGMADIELDASKKTLKMKKLGQGTVVAAFGTAIMLGALYFLTR